MTNIFFQIVSAIFILTSFSVQSANQSMYIDDFSKLRNEFLTEDRSFIEIHLEDKKVRKYVQGIFEKEYDILAKGEPKDWGGSAVGIYSVLAKYRSAYSTIAEAYMPWSIRYYGKYYIHGEPYYSSGNKLISSVSGGCIRLKDGDMKEVYDEVNKEDLILVIDKENDNYQYSSRELSEFPNLSSKSYLVADLQSGYIFSSKNINRELPVASLTKLMNALVISENVDLRRYITVNSEMLEPYGSTDGLRIGYKFRPVDLFYPLLIESSNDAAEVLGSFLGKEKTIKLMNEKAEAIMMDRTRFTDLSGYDSGNISSAQNIFYLLRYIYNNRPNILDISKGKEGMDFSKNRFDGLENKNYFYEQDNFLGGKAGYIKASGYCGAFVFQLETREGIKRDTAVIILGADKKEKGEDSLKVQTEMILGWLEDNYFEK